MRNVGAILCSSKAGHSNLTLYGGESLVFYNHSQLIKIYELLDRCFGNGIPCTAWKAAAPEMKRDPFSETCRFHISIPKTLTLCFAKDRFLEQGFINETILSPTDIIFLYQITKFWVQQKV